MGEEIKKVTELASDKKGYISGIKYYYDILMRTDGIAEDTLLYRTMVDFGVELEDLIRYEDGTSVQAMSDLFDRFYPEGEIHPIFDNANMNTALDGISECLYRLKKEFRIGRFV